MKKGRGATMTHESSATGRRRSSRLSTCSELVVFESSGAHHRQIEIMLAARAILFVKVNPRQARRFAEAIGKLVKTDRVDAAMLAKDGCGAGAQGSSPCERKIYVLKDLLVARRALFRDQTAAAFGRKPGCKSQIAARPRQIEKHLAELNGAVLEAVRADQDLPRPFEIPKWIPVSVRSPQWQFSSR